MSSAPLRTIRVDGDALHARFVAALLAQSLAPHGCAVTLGDISDDEPASQPVILGPIVRQAFEKLGIGADALLAAGAEQRFHWDVPRMKIWSTPFGLPRGGVDFHHHLHRIEGALTHEAILPFNPAARVGEWVAANGPLKESPIPYGFKLERQKLLALLEGANVPQMSASQTADFAIGVLGDGSAEWSDAELTIPTGGAFPELGPYRCVTAVERFLALVPGAGDSPAGQAEFNRLSQAEHDRIGDFAALLVGDLARPAVVRKHEVFTACGKIPIEDHEVIPAHYWLSVFLQSDIEPRDYDRLADRFPREETAAWIESLRQQLGRLSNGPVA